MKQFPMKSLQKRVSGGILKWICAGMSACVSGGKLERTPEKISERIEKKFLGKSMEDFLKKFLGEYMKTS